MIGSFRIQGFRCFKDLELRDLGRVNLIVGANSVGKSTVLEALDVWSGGFQGWCIAWELLHRRQELGPMGRAGRVRNLTSAQRIFRSTSPGSSTSRATLTAVPVDGTSLRHRELELSLLKEDQPLKAAAAWRLDDDTGSLVDFIAEFWDQLALQVAATREGRASFVLTHREATNLSALWERTELTPRKDRLIEALRLVVPEIMDVAVTTHADTSTVKVRLEGATAPVPLLSLGEGLHHLFYIALAAVNAGGGLLLIDEVESGLHFTVQEQLWRFLFEVASQEDLQIFATTHSMDCIRAFQSAAAAHPEEGALIRLHREGADIFAETFNEADLEVVTRGDIEVRW